MNLRLRHAGRMLAHLSTYVVTSGRWLSLWVLLFLVVAVVVSATVTAVVPTAVYALF